MPQIQFDEITKIYPVTKSDFRKKMKSELSRLTELAEIETDSIKKKAIEDEKSKLSAFSKKPEKGQLQAHILADFSLEIADGEFTVFVGPSGCGKSTALRVLAGLEEPSSGSIKIASRRVNDLPSRDRDIAFVFQSYALYPHMNVFENIAFGLRLRKFTEAEIQKKTREAAELLQLVEHLHKKPKQLSGGQRQRVAMGRALVRDASIFLFDEPLSNLDAQLRQEMRAQIKNLTRNLRTTSVYVTHDQVEAMTLADKIVVLNRISDGNGKNIRQIATPSDVYNYPADIFTAKFIGTPQINIIPINIKSEGDKMFLVGESTEILLSNTHIRQIQASGAKNICCGFRPHDIALVSEGQPADISGLCEVSEFLGNEAHIHVKAGTNILRAVLPHSLPPSSGTTVHLKIQNDKLMLFDADSGRNLYYP